MVLRIFGRFGGSSYSRACFSVTAGAQVRARAQAILCNIQAYRRYREFDVAANSPGGDLITFYYGSGSPYAWRVWFALEHKELAFDLRQMSFSTGELKSADYLRINPRGKVPAIEDNGFSLYESSAIVEYLEDRYPGSGAALFPGDVRTRARIRCLVNEADVYLDAASRRLLQAVLFTNKEHWDEDRIDAGRSAVAAELSNFEDRLSGEFYVETISAADFTIYPMIALLLRMDLRKPDLGMASLVGPKMSAWMKRIEAMPLHAKTYPPHWRTQ